MKHTGHSRVRRYRRNWVLVVFLIPLCHLLWFFVLSGIWISLERPSQRSKTTSGVTLAFADDGKFIANSDEDIQKGERDKQGEGGGTIQNREIESAKNKIQSSKRQIAEIQKRIDDLRNERQKLWDEWDRSSDKELIKNDTSGSQKINAKQVSYTSEELAYYAIAEVLNKYPSKSLHLYLDMSQQSFTKALLDYMSEKDDRKKWSSEEQCLNHYIKKVDHYANPSPQDQRNPHELEILRKCFVRFEKGDNNSANEVSRNNAQDSNIVKARAHRTSLDVEITYINNLIEPLIREQESLKQELATGQESVNHAIAENRRAISIKNHINAIKSGAEEPKNIADYAILFNASSNTTYETNPPLDGPSRDDQYFLWSGTLVKKDWVTYIVWDSFQAKGFGFKNIKKKMGELRQDTKVRVVGRYTSNSEISLTSGETKTIPVLSDCYVSGSGPLEERKEETRESTGDD